MKLPPLLPALLVLALAGCAASDAPSRARGTAPRDVVFITCDTLRADHLTLDGYPRPTTPELARFAESAIVFERAYAHAAETRPSVGSLMSGFLPHETRVGMEGRPLEPQIETLAERLDAAGYRTFAVIGNYMLRAELGWDQGFDTYDDELTESEQVRDMPERTAVATADRAIELLDRHAGSDRPLFAWIHFQDPHGPYVPPAEATDAIAGTEPPQDAPWIEAAGPDGRLPVNESISGRGGIPSYQFWQGERAAADYVARYDGEIRFFDRELGRLLRAMERHERFDDALLLFTSDHGEELGGHGTWFSHGESLYDALVRIPLIVRFGDGAAGRVEHFVQQLDVLPTVLAAVGLPVPDTLRGVDLRDTAPRAIAAEARAPQMPHGAQASLILDGYKLIETPRIESFELYALKEDPAEQVNLADDLRYRERLREMLQTLVRLRAEDRLQVGDGYEAREIDGEERRRLDSLGYFN